VFDSIGRRGGTWARIQPMRGQARALLAGALGVAISTLSSYALYRAELERDRAQFEQQARSLRVALEATFSSPLQTLRALPPFFAASQSIEREEFAAYVESGLRDQPGIAYLAWAPQVEQAERTEYERRARESGWSEFAIREPGPGGWLRPAAKRERYLPLLHVEPGDEHLLGLDLLADPVHRATIQAAFASGELSSAPGLPESQADPAAETISVYAPLTPAAPASADPRVPRRGLAVLVLRVGPLVRASVAHGLDDMEVVVLDESEPSGEHVLFESIPGARGLSLARHADWTERMRYCGRRWVVHFWAKPGSQSAGSLPLALGVLGVLSSLAGMLALGAIEVVNRLRNDVRKARQLGQYRLVRKLGEGGMGVVYQAEHALLRRPTAVKAISPRAGGRQLVERFEREVLATSHLTHPNTVAVFDFGYTPEGVFYYAMEYLEGVTLDVLVRTVGPLPPARVVHLLQQVCASLAEAHAHGLVHRDIKPSNIMICERGGIADFVKVLDFGLVKDTTAEAITRHSHDELVGTPQYMAPEALRGVGNAGPAVDLYALGAVAYFALTGHEVFEGSSLSGLIACLLFEEPEPPSLRLGQPLPTTLEALVLRCLSKDPERRPASAEELIALLEGCQVPRWTQAEAKDFWRHEGERVRASKRAEVLNGSLDDTLAVDRAARASGAAAA
jgi:CHASE1-domain containing sensor protein